MDRYFILSIVIQVALIVHCVKTGRNFLWILAIGLLPFAGSLAYVLIEIVPGLFRSRGSRVAMRGMRKALDPSADLRRYQTEASVIGDVASRQRYADELTRHGRASEAIDVYSQVLTGLYESDPDLLLGLARAQFAAGAYRDARQTYERLMERNPQFHSPDGHLLYARSLEAEGNQERALSEYAAVTGYFAGAEAPLRYAQLLAHSGRSEEARRVLRDLLEHARLAPRHYRRMQQHWLVSAERELTALG